MRCANSELLPSDLLRQAVQTADPGRVMTAVNCALSPHGETPHHGLVCELDGPDTGAVWTSWTDEGPPTELVTLPDRVPTGEREACPLFAGHAGDHGGLPAE